MIYNYLELKDIYKYIFIFSYFEISGIHYDSIETYLFWFDLYFISLLKSYFLLITSWREKND